MTPSKLLHFRGVRRFIKMKNLLTGVISLTRVLYHRICGGMSGSYSGYSILNSGLGNFFLINFSIDFFPLIYLFISFIICLSNFLLNFFCFVYSSHSSISFWYFTSRSNFLNQYRVYNPSTYPKAFI